MMKVATSFTAHRTGEGLRISYTYSKIDDDGNLIANNGRKDIIAVKPEIVSALETVETFINQRLASEA